MRSLPIKRHTIPIMYGLGALLLIVAGALWCNRQMTDPERVFWGTVQQGLRTNGVTIKAYQTTDNATVDQTLQYSLGALNRSFSRTTLKQTGTTVVTETLGTTDADYTRYVSVDTTQKRQDGKDLNFSKIIGVWAKNPQHQLFSQAVLGTGLPIGGMVLPIGSLSPELQEKLIQQIKNDRVYKVDYAKAAKKRVNGRLQITYDVKIQPMAYAKLMKEFARSVGLHDLDRLDPQNYNGQPDLSLQLILDATARHLVGVKLSQNTYSQTYHAYDVPVSAGVPEKTITVAELQDRLRSL